MFVEYLQRVTTSGTRLRRRTLAGGVEFDIKYEFGNALFEVWDPLCIGGCVVEEDDPVIERRGLVPLLFLHQPLEEPRTSVPAVKHERFFEIDFRLVRHDPVCGFDERFTQSRP